MGSSIIDRLVRWLITIELGVRKSKATGPVNVPAILEKDARSFSKMNNRNETHDGPRITVKYHVIGCNIEGDVSLT